MKVKASFYCVKKCLFVKTGKKYADGGKYCDICRCWVIWGKVSCPCCRARLRTSPRSRKGREAQQKRNGVKRM